MAKRRATRWLFPVGLALLFGLVLAILSVPAAALVSQRWGAFSTGSSMMGEMHRIPVRGAGDGIYFLTEHHQPAATTQTPTSTRMTITTSDRRGVLMRLRGSTRAAPSYAAQFLEGEHELEPHAGDPRPAFLRPPPPEGYTTVEALSAGWPWHAAYGLRSKARGQPTIESGLVALPLGRTGDVMPWRPIWSGLSANTLVYAAMLLAPWMGLRLARSARRHHRTKRGRCAGCGYQLDDGMERCPECGMARHPSAAN